MENKYHLLLTACIAPNAGDNLLKRINPVIRLKDYTDTLTKWLHYADNRISSIIFIENSGYDLTEIKNIFREQNIFNRQIEILQYKENEYNSSVHYGYYEYKMLSYAAQNSLLLDENDCVIKVTGRLFFEKLTELINIYIYICNMFFFATVEYIIFILKKQTIFLLL